VARCYKPEGLFRMSSLDIFQLTQSFEPITVILKLIQPLTDMSAGNLPWAGG
jgi:hypothetical protein